MAQLRRLFVTRATDTVALSPEEAHYARDVLRLAAGDAVVLLDGQGACAPGILQQAGRKAAVTVTPTAPWETCAGLGQPRQELVLLVPLPKGERADWLVEKVTEFACLHLRPVTCTYSQGGKEAGENKRLARLQRVARAAARQARHGRPPLLEPESWPLAAALEDTKRRYPQAQRWVAHVAAGAPSFAAACTGHGARQQVVLLGPEGGLTQDELNLARSFGYTPVRLGPHVLRVETAAVAVAAACTLAC